MKDDNAIEIDDDRSDMCIVVIGKNPNDGDESDSA